MALRPHDDDLLLAVDGDAVGGRKGILLLAGRLDAVDEQHGQRRQPERGDDLQKITTGWTIRATHHPMLGSATPPSVVRNQRVMLAIARQAQRPPRAVVARERAPLRPPEHHAIDHEEARRVPS